MSFDALNNPSLGVRKEDQQCGRHQFARSGTRFGQSRTAQAGRAGTFEQRSGPCGGHQFAGNGSYALLLDAKAELERSTSCGDRRSGRSGTKFVLSPAARLATVDPGLEPEGSVDRFQAFWMVGFVCCRAQFLTAHTYEKSHSIQEEVSDLETVEAKHDVAASRQDCAQKPRGKGGSCRSLRGTQATSPGEGEPPLQGQDSAGGPARSRDRAGLTRRVADQATPIGGRGSSVEGDPGIRGLHREDGRAREPGDHAADRLRSEGQVNEAPRTPTASAGRSPSPLPVSSGAPVHWSHAARPSSRFSLLLVGGPQGG